MKYNLEFNFYYLLISNIKEKNFYLIANYLTGGRFAQKLRFKCPANITFEETDKKHQYPIVTELETYKRKYTNCLEFDMIFDNDNRGYYDKLFLYYSDGKMPSYGYLLYNTETNESLHQFLIYGDINDVFYSLNNTFNSLHCRKLYNFYARKYYASRKTHNYTMSDYPVESELKEILKEMKG